MALLKGREDTCLCLVIFREQLNITYKNTASVLQVYTIPSPWDRKREKQDEYAKKSPSNEQRRLGELPCAHAQTDSASRTPALLLAPEKTSCVDALAKHATQSTPHAFGLAFGVHLSAIKVNGAVIVYCKILGSCLGRFICCNCGMHNVCVMMMLLCYKETWLHACVPLFDANGTHESDFVEWCINRMCRQLWSCFLSRSRLIRV